MGGKKTDLDTIDLKELLSKGAIDVIKPESDAKELEQYESSHAFDFSRKPAEDDVILYCQEEEIGSRASLVTVTGKVKSRKTVVVSAMMSACFKLGSPILTFRVDLKPGERALHIDTEQNYRHYYTTVARVFNDAGIEIDKGVPENFRSFHCRDATIAFRNDFIEYLLEKHKPAICFLDGVTDIIYDINNQREATEVGEKFLSWGVKYNCLFVVVIHTTKATGYMTGALGTYLEKKCETSIKVEKEEKNDAISSVICQYSRNKQFATFSIQYDKIVGRYVVADEQDVGTKGKKGKKDPELYADDIHTQVLNRIFIYAEKLGAEEMPKKIAHFAKEVTSDSLSNGLAKQWLNYYSTRAFIFADPDGNWRRIQRTEPKAPPEEGVIMRAQREEGLDFETSTSDDLPF